MLGNELVRHFHDCVLRSGSGKIFDFLLDLGLLWIHKSSLNSSLLILMSSTYRIVTMILTGWLVIRSIICTDSGGSSLRFWGYSLSGGILNVHVSGRKLFVIWDTSIPYLLMSLRSTHIVSSILGTISLVLQILLRYYTICVCVATLTTILKFSFGKKVGFFFTCHHYWGLIVQAIHEIFHSLVRLIWQLRRVLTFDSWTVRVLGRELAV